MAARASSSISSGVSGSPWRASCQLKAKSASCVSTPVCSGSSRGPLAVGRRSSTAVAVRSRPRLRGHMHVDAPGSQRGDALVEQADQLVGVEGDLVGHPQLQQPVEHRPGVGGAGAARCTAWVRARSPKPWSTASPVHSRAASQTRSGSCSSWTWGTTRTAPGDQLLLVGLDPQRDPHQLGQVSCARRVRGRGACGGSEGSAREARRAARQASTTAATLGPPVGVASAASRPRPRRRRLGATGPPGSKTRATSRIPAAPPPRSAGRWGGASSRGRRVSTGSAPRIGSVTVRRAVAELDRRPRAGVGGPNLAGPVTGTSSRSNLRR